MQQRKQRDQPPQPIHIVVSKSAQIDPEIHFFSQPVPRCLLTSSLGAESWELSQGKFDQILALETSMGKIDFAKALKGIYMLPNNSKFGVYAAYKYYKRLLRKLERASYLQIKSERVRVPNYQKVDVLARSYVRYRLNIL